MKTRNETNRKNNAKERKIVNYLIKNNGLKLPELESDLILFTSKPDTRKDLFSWDQIPGNDNLRLMKFVSRYFGIDMLKTAKIEKIDNGNIIIVNNYDDEEKIISLKLDPKKTKVNLTIDDGRTYTFMVKMENDELKIYPSRIGKVHSRKVQQYDILCYNKKNNDIVIVEVKSDNANYGTFGQILYYLAQVETITYPWNLDVNTVRGIIIARKIDVSLKKLVNKYKNVTPKINLIEYKGEVEKNLIFKEITLSGDL